MSQVKAADDCWQLGSLVFNTRLIQGPLAGISNRTFRRLIWQYSKPAYTTTEMICARSILARPDWCQKVFLNRAPEEKVVCLQLAGHDPDELAKAVEIVSQWNVDLLDLNLGCPQRKIRQRGMGSRLLETPELIIGLVKAMQDHCDLPVTVKIRVGREDDSDFNQRLASALNDAQPDGVVVHGRHYTERYERSCRYDAIAYFVNTLNCPVIGNGDVEDAGTFDKMMRTGVTAAMIGRGGIGQPWLIDLLEKRNKACGVFSTAERGRLFLRHIDLLSEEIGCKKAALFQGRSLFPYYARTLEVSDAVLSALNHCECRVELEQLINQTFAD